MTMPPPPSRVDRGRRDRAVLASTGTRQAIDDDAHRKAIEQSHQRCAALGVLRIDAPDFARIGRADLKLTLQRNRRLHDHAAPVMSLLHEQIARTESMVILTDAAGTIVHAVGDDDFLDRADRVALKPGANWSEGAKGTNAIGTALVDELPTLVHADEHYLHANQFLTCSAAPILDPRGNILGVLDVSGDFRSYQQHTLALVRMSARLIENRWLTEDFGHALRLHFHERPGFIGTLAEGILAVNEDGRVVGANRGALEQLGLSGAAVRMQTLESLFGTTIAALADRARAQLAVPMTLSTPAGRTFAAYARCNWLAWGAMPKPPVAAARPQAPAQATAHVEPGMPDAPDAPAPALSRLLTGDAHWAAAIHKLCRVLDRGIPVVVLGEPGTGRRTVARAMHADSARRQRPLVAVDCAARPEAALEAAIDAAIESVIDAARIGPAGKAPAGAEGGTLLLESIDALPRALQARLPSALDRSGAAAGGVALIATAQRSLGELVELGAFDPQLFACLGGLAVRLPPLRARTDLPALAQRILDGRGGPVRHQLAPDAAGVLLQHRWPGNVRELVQVLHTACVMAGESATIGCEHLSDDLADDFADELRPSESRPPESRPPESRAAQAAQPPGADPLDAPGDRTLDDMQLELIRRTVDAAGGNISEASKRLGISRNTIYRKLRWKRG